jgi:hypothetical protein
MSMTIYQTNDSFDFSKLQLSHPVMSSSGTFFSKLTISPTDDPLFIYTPKSTTKQGIVNTNNKIYTDISLTTVNSNIIQWISSLEEKLQQLIYEKRDVWFATENIELDDIQNAFIPMLKIYKNTNYLLRCYIQQSRQQLKGDPLLIYNENEQPCSISDINENTSMITILEIQGIKFSQKCFHVPIMMKQIMIFEKTVFTNCLIKQINPMAQEVKQEKQEVARLSQQLPEVKQDIKEENEIEDLNIVDLDKYETSDIINLKNPIDEYNAILQQMEEHNQHAKQAYMKALELKQQYDIDDEIEMPLI